MSFKDIIRYLTLWSLVGAAIFSAFVVIAFRSGLVYTSRKEDGTLKDKVPLRGILTMVTLWLVIMGFLVTANYLGLVRQQIAPGISSLFLLNLVLYLILFLFDTIIIDGFVLSYWRPDFLHLSDQLGRESMREHILKSIPVGILFGLLITA